MEPDLSMNQAPRRKGNELVYYMHDGSAAFRFQLAGDLSQDNVQDLEQARQTASSIIGRRNLMVDLSGLTSIDAAGRGLLKQWQALGAQLTAHSSHGRARIQLMADVPITVVGTKAEGSKWLPSRAAALWLAALLALLLAATAVARSSRRNAAGSPSVPGYRQSAKIPATRPIYYNGTVESGMVLNISWGSLAL
jgi:ABC-type transporter Mla MlaB component